MSDVEIKTIKKYVDKDNILLLKSKIYNFKEKKIIYTLDFMTPFTKFYCENCESKNPIGCECECDTQNMGFFDGKLVETYDFEFIDKLYVYIKKNYDELKFLDLIELSIWFENNGNNFICECFNKEYIYLYIIIEYFIHIGIFSELFLLELKILFEDKYSEILTTNIENKYENNKQIYEINILNNDEIDKSYSINISNRDDINEKITSLKWHSVNKILWLKYLYKQLDDKNLYIPSKNLHNNTFDWYIYCLNLYYSYEELFIYKLKEFMDKEPIKIYLEKNNLEVHNNLINDSIDNSIDVITLNEKINYLYEKYKKFTDILERLK
jgi:hypothetical protein